MMGAEIDNDNHDRKAKRFLAFMLNALTRDDRMMLSEIIAEWYKSTVINDILTKWMPFKKPTAQEFDILVLDEVGQVDFSLINAVFRNYRCFYQPDENVHERVLPRSIKTDVRFGSFSYHMKGKNGYI